MGLLYYISPHNIRSKSLTCRHIHCRSVRGQTLAEYALILAFISVVAIASLLSMGGKVSSVYTTVNQQMTTAETGGATTTSRSH